MKVSPWKPSLRKLYIPVIGISCLWKLFSSWSKSLRNDANCFLLPQILPMTKGSPIILLIKKLAHHDMRVQRKYPRIWNKTRIQRREYKLCCPCNKRLTCNSSLRPSWTKHQTSSPQPFESIVVGQGWHPQFPWDCYFLTNHHNEKHDASMFACVVLWGSNLLGQTSPPLPHPAIRRAFGNFNNE